MSPLFETPAGLETGARVIERLLDEEAYRDYVEARAPAMQTGFSDAGRFVGQIAARLAIERLHHGLAEAIAGGAQGRRDADLLDARRVAWAAARIPARCARACATCSRMIALALRRARDADQARDELPGRRRLSVLRQPRARRRARWRPSSWTARIPARERSVLQDTNLALDFLARLRDYQQQLFAHPGYRAVLGAFGPNLLFKTGSRPVKRQRDHALGSRRRPACAPFRTTRSCSSSAMSRTSLPGSVRRSAAERERFVEMASSLRGCGR